MYDIIEGIKLQYMEQKIIMNEEILKKLGYNTIALEMLLKREAQIDPKDIIMPGEYQSINNNSDQDAIQISLENIHKQFLTLDKTIKSLPNEYDGDGYFGDLKTELISLLDKVDSKIESLMTQAGMDTSTDDLDYSLD
jgi:hypothetical protein